ncbi:MAG: cytidylate kinase-like family protein, partial [Mitsuokella jalaludinii]|nr:cytidylate kinase-like family protein [Mitsuokella jalaludinii]
MEKHMLITISRQFGSGGREVSEILAKKLGVRRYDKKIVEMAADNIEDGMDPKEAVELSYNTPSNCLGNLGDYGYERV